MLYKMIARCLAVGCSLLMGCSTCPAEAEHDKSEKRQEVGLNLGLIRSIVVPVSWQREESALVKGLTFLKRRKHWSDCLISLHIAEPASITSAQAQSLRNNLKSIVISKNQINMLNDLPNIGTVSGDRDQVMETVYNIGGRQKSVIEHRGQFNGPCESLAGGRSRMPRLNYVRGTAYVLTGPNQMQSITFDTDVMGETKPCLEQIRAALKSIRWKENK